MNVETARRRDVNSDERVARAVPRAKPENTHEARWTRCPSCNAFLYLRRLRHHRQVCPECSYHLRLSVRERLELLLDAGSFHQVDRDLQPVDVLSFTDSKPYPERISAAQRRTGSVEAAVWGTGTVEGHAVVVAVLNFAFLGGSIGGVTGELVARAARRALADQTPLLLVSASGGARMQEGAISLMQLAKTSQEIGRLRGAGVLCLNLNTDPTFGGATASFAMLGDIVLAEPGARIGFAGPAVIKQTIRQDLPPGFQTAEFLRDNGMVDLVVPREAVRATVARLLALHASRPVAWIRQPTGYLTHPAGLTGRPAAEVVRLARDTRRPTTLDYCARLFDDFVELHGDRLGADDPAVVGGIAKLDGRPVVVIGHQKGHETHELVRRNFGMPQPAGYHKAHRLMEYAERHRWPLVSFVDTPGAYPGLEAEQRGQGTAIAEAILRMSRLRVPTVAVVTGEGGSGGALAFAVGNRVLMLENAYFSVISPEGCSTILFGSAANSAQAADALRITAADLLRLGVIDGVVPEPGEGAHTDCDATARCVRAAVRTCLEELAELSPDGLVDDRYARFCRFGDVVRQPILHEGTR